MNLQQLINTLLGAAPEVGKGLVRGVTADVVGAPVDTLNAVRQGLLTPAEAGNPYARQLGGLLGPVQQTGSSDYFAQQMGLPEGQGMAYEAGRMLSPSPADIVSAFRRAPSIQELITYHGTPHQFPATEANPLGEFDASKIGTGEGAQAYGHGIYLAESPEVAKIYRANRAYVGQHMAGQPVTQDFGPEWYAQKTLDEAGSPEVAIERINRWIKSTSSLKAPGMDAERESARKAIELIKSGAVGLKGSFYTADLPDEMIDRMLDWDKPLSEQPKAVREALKRRITSVEPTDKFDMGGNSLLRDNRLGQYDKTRADPWILEASGANGTSAFGLSQKDVDRMFGSKDVSNLTGEQIISRLAQQQGGQAAASKYLADLGIPGIKYLDQGSRNEGKGTRNFVVFPGEEKKVKILKRD